MNVKTDAPLETTAAPAIRLEVDRTRALVRGLWRVVIGSLVLVGVVMADVRWSLLWRTDKATFMAYGTLCLAAAAAGLALLLPGLKWIALCLSSKPLAIVLDDRGLSMNLGPFGRYEFDANRLSIEVDREIDPELLEHMPDDAFMPTIRHPSSPKDLVIIIQVFTGLASEKLTAILRPRLMHRSTPSDNAVSSHVSSK